MEAKQAFELYHAYFEEFMEFFSISREMVRCIMNHLPGKDVRPPWYQICSLAMYWATDVESEMHDRFEMSFHNSLVGYVERLQPSRDDLCNVIDFLCHIGLHEYQMIVMQYVSALSVASAPLRL